MESLNNSAISNNMNRLSESVQNVGKERTDIITRIQKMNHKVRTVSFYKFPIS